MYVCTSAAQQQVLSCALNYNTTDENLKGREPFVKSWYISFLVNLISQCYNIQLSRRQG